MHRERDFLQADVLQHVKDRQRVGQHCQREIVSAQAERGNADDNAGGRARHSAERDANPWCHAEIDQQQRCGVGADAEERSVAEGKLAAVAGQQVP